MKTVFLNVLLGFLLAGYPARGQSGMRGGSQGTPAVGFGNAGSFVEHNPPILFHGETVPGKSGPISRTIGEPRGPGHFGDGGDRGSDPHRMFGTHGDFGDRRISRGGLFDHDHDFGRGHHVLVFVYGVPYYYPLYYPDPGAYDSQPYYAADSPAATEYPAEPDPQPAQSVNQGTDSFYQPGYQWGGEMKLYHVTLDQFVTYLKAYILTASPVQQAAFRSGFVAHFGADGQAIYDQAVQQAIPQN